MRVAVIETGIAPKEINAITSRGEPISLTATLRACSVGNSFLIDDVRKKASVHAIAHKIGARVRTEKTPQGLRVYRI